MTPNEAYRKGQEDMRRRICEQWRDWRTAGVSGEVRAHRSNKRDVYGYGYADVSVRIRVNNKVRDLSGQAEAT